MLSSGRHSGLPSRESLPAPCQFNLVRGPRVSCLQGRSQLWGAEFNSTRPVIRAMLKSLDDSHKNVENRTMTCFPLRTVQLLVLPHPSRLAMFVLCTPDVLLDTMSSEPCGGIGQIVDAQFLSTAKASLSSLSSNFRRFDGSSVRKQLVSLASGAFPCIVTIVIIAFPREGPL